MGRFTVSRPRAQRSRRQTQWGLGPGSGIVTPLSATGSALLGGGVSFAQSGTVVRIRGGFQVYLRTVTSPGDGYHGAVGIGLVSKAAFTAGIGSVPTPIIEAAWDGWLWHRFFDCHAGVVGDSSDSIAFRAEIDSKAMRKVSDEMVLYSVIEATEIGTAVLDVFLDSRLLLKLG